MSQVNPSYLLEDELLVELEIRKISRNSPDFDRTLAEHWQYEAMGTRNRPTGLPSSFTTPHDEVRLCTNKLNSLQKDVSTLSIEYDETNADRASLRLKHIICRLERMILKFPETSEMVHAIVNQANSLMRRLKDGSSYRDSLSATALPENTRAFSPVSRNSLTSHGGTIPKTNGAISSTVQPPDFSRPPPIFSFPPMNVQHTGRISNSETVAANWQPGRVFEEDIMPQASHYDAIPSRSIDKWKIKFDGNPQLMHVSEFIFRVETLAQSSNVSLRSLARNIHYLLSGNAANWYWVYLRTNPNANWEALKIEMMEEYTLEESDAEIRKQVESRKQLVREPFNAYCLAIRSLLVRLKRPVDEAETVDILRRNMSYDLREALLYQDTPSVRILSALCRKSEKLWQQRDERNRGRGVHEVQGNVPDNELVPYREAAEVNPLHVDAAEFIVCWNCKEMGHPFMDCTAPRTVFCYGCGTAEVYKPQCAKCNHQGNAQRNIPVPGQRYILPANRRPDQNPPNRNQ